MTLPKPLLVLVAAAALAGGAYYARHRDPHPDPLVAGLQLDPFPLRALPGWEVAASDLSPGPERSPGEVARLLVNLSETGGSARRDVVFSVFENAEHAARNFRETTAYDPPSGCIRPRDRIANCHVLADRTVAFVVFLDGGEEVAKTTDLIQALAAHVSNVAARVVRKRR
jgi:hypothetical protein